MAAGPFIPPCIPTLVDAPPEGGRWTHEIKYDGYRTQIHLAGGKARAFTRNGHDWSKKYGPVLGAGAQYALTDNWSLRAEYLYVDLQDSRASFEDGDTYSYDFDNNIHVVRLGASYSF